MERNRGNSANSAQESSGTDSASVPVIPLPTPDQGQPIQPDDGAGVPVIPLPTPDQGQPIQPDDGAGIPVIPLPNPGEGGPTCPVSYTHLDVYKRQGFPRKPLGKQKIARVSVRRLDDLILFSRTLDILEQNDFHGQKSSF